MGVQKQKKKHSKEIKDKNDFNRRLLIQALYNKKSIKANKVLPNKTVQVTHIIIDQKY